MDINRENILIEYMKDETTLVSLKWLRGANRYNNGATIYGKKYLLRYLFNNIKILRYKK